MIQRALPSGRSTWTAHTSLAEKTELQHGPLEKWSESAPDLPRILGEAEQVARTERPRTTGDSDHLAGRELRYAPSVSDDNSICEVNVEGSQVDTIAAVEKGAGTASVAASARAGRRTTISSAHRVTASNASRSDPVVSSAPTSEPVSPQRPGAAIRRSRSMPAPRKSAEDSAPKPKLARSFTRHRALATGSSSSMPKSTAAAAAGAGAVAAKKRAKSSKKLMLPFAYAEDDPRVKHVEAAEAPEARLPPSRSFSLS
jgi:hypothetical protein